MFGLLFCLPCLLNKIHVWAVKVEVWRPKPNWYWYSKPFGNEVFIEKCRKSNCPFMVNGRCTCGLDVKVDNGETRLVIGRWQIMFNPFWVKPLARQVVGEGVPSLGGFSVIDGGLLTKFDNIT